MFKWLFRQKDEEVKDRWFFLDEDVTDYQYLGRTELKFTSDTEPKKVTSSASVFSFCRKDDPDDRMAIMDPRMFHTFQYHPWFMNIIPVWIICEHPLEHTVWTEPSEWLMTYMFDNKTKIWDYEQSKWIVSKNKPEISKEEDNVVKLSFHSSKKDVDIEEKVE